MFQRKHKDTEPAERTEASGRKARGRKPAAPAPAKPFVVILARL